NVQLYLTARAHRLLHGWRALKRVSARGQATLYGLRRSAFLSPLVLTIASATPHMDRAGGTRTSHQAAGQEIRRALAYPRRMDLHKIPTRHDRPATARGAERRSAFTRCGDPAPLGAAAACARVA